MSTVEAVSNLHSIPQKDISPTKIHSEEAENFVDALKKMKHGQLRLSEKQTSVFGITCIAFAANVLLFGEKLGIQKLGPLAPIIGASALLAGALGVLFCGEIYGKKAEQKLTKLLGAKETQTTMVAMKNSPEKHDTTTQKLSEAKVSSKDYKDIGLDLTQN